MESPTPSSRLDRLRRLREPTLAVIPAATSAGIVALAALAVPEILRIGQGIPDWLGALTLGMLPLVLIFIQGILLLLVGILAMLLAGLGGAAGAVLAHRPGPWRPLGVLGVGMCVLSVVGGLVSLLL